MTNQKLITLTIEQGEEVMEALEWAVDCYEEQDDIDRKMYEIYRSTYHSIKQQLRKEEDS
tara:strand:+ start:202 stop:381 length:180 start_codon:yes stop_codon:yes gene_type:complete